MGTRVTSKPTATTGIHVNPRHLLDQITQPFMGNPCIAQWSLPFPLVQAAELALWIKLSGITSKVRHIPRRGVATLKSAGSRPCKNVGRLRLCYSSSCCQLLDGWRLRTFNRLFELRLGNARDPGSRVLLMLRKSRIPRGLLTRTWYPRGYQVQISPGALLRLDLIQQFTTSPDCPGFHAASAIFQVLIEGLLGINRQGKARSLPSRCCAPTDRYPKPSAHRSGGAPCFSARHRRRAAGAAVGAADPSSR